MTLADPRLIATLREMARYNDDGEPYHWAPTLSARLSDAGLAVAERSSSSYKWYYRITPAGRAELARIDKEAAK